MTLDNAILYQDGWDNMLYNHEVLGSYLPQESIAPTHTCSVLPSSDPSNSATWAMMLPPLYEAVLPPSGSSDIKVYQNYLAYHMNLEIQAQELLSRQTLVWVSLPCYLDLKCMPWQQHKA